MMFPHSIACNYSLNTTMTMKHKRIEKKESLLIFFKNLLLQVRLYGSAALNHKSLLHLIQLKKGKKKKKVL